MDRRFTKEEAQQIFAAAAQRQQASRTVEERLTLAELEEAARAAGIDASYVRDAAESLLRPVHTDVVRRSFGLHLERRRSVSLPKALTKSEWPHIVRELRDVFSERGITSEMGSIYEWSSHAERGSMPYHVTAEVQEGDTRVTIERNASQLAMVFIAMAATAFVLGVVLIAGALVQGNDVLPQGLIVPLFGVAAAAAGYTVSHFSSKREARRFEEAFAVFDAALRTDDHSEVRTSNESTPPIHDTNRSGERVLNDTNWSGESVLDVDQEASSEPSADRQSQKRSIRN